MRQPLGASQLGFDQTAHGSSLAMTRGWARAGPSPLVQGFLGGEGRIQSEGESF